jgi:hypothetical protein
LPVGKIISTKIKYLSKMEGDLINMVTDVVAALNAHEESNFGPITESDFKVSMNDFDEEAGIGFKAQFLMAGPVLDKIKQDGASLYPGKSAEDLFGYISIKVSGDPNELIEQIKGLIDAFGLPMDQLEQFGELKFHAGDGEVLIGFKAASQFAGMAQPFLVKSGVFGDGSQDITMETSFNLGTTWDQMLDDEPIFTHFLKGFSTHSRGRLHDKTRENILKVVSEKNESAGSIMESPLPFIMPLLFFKRMTGAVELQCTDEMKEQIKNFVTTHFAPAAMSLKEAFEMIKGMGMPLEMIQPILEMIQGAGVSEISLNGAGNLGLKLTIRLPGLDKAIAEFLS